MLKAAEAMVKCLESESVKVVFGLPGAAICPFYDALTKSDIRHILVRHEQNAAHAASGYARMTKKPAVCIATSGPGALNLITGIATAYMDSVPLVVITGQVSSELLGRDVFQEADITGSCEPFVKHSYLVKDAADIPRIFKEAFTIAGTGRNGPVLIDVPIDVQNQLIDFHAQPAAQIRSYKPSLVGHPGQIKRVVAAMKKAKRPLLCAGGGVFAASAEEALLALSQKCNLPIVTTMMGIGSISPLYENYLGMIGMHGDSNANEAMHTADLILLVGARVGDRAVSSPIGLSENAQIIHIDIDPAEIGKNVPTDIPIVGDAKNVLCELAAQLDECHAESWYAKRLPKSELCTAATGTLDPRAVIHALCKQLHDDAVLVADVGQNQIWSARGYQIPSGRFLTSGGMGTMGYSIPAAYGAKLANPDRQVVAICGDGSFQMQMMELATLKANHIPIKIIVMNNGHLGMVRELQDLHYGGREIAVELNGNPNFTALSAAYGITSKTITQNDEIDSAVSALLAEDSPFLLECIIDEKEPTLTGGKS